MKYEVNKEILKKAKKQGHCVCDPNKTCLCDDFLDKDECICGAFKKVKD